MMVILATTIVVVPTKYQERKNGRGRERGKKEEIKMKNNKGGPLATKPRAFLLCFLNIFVILLATSKFQGLGLVWVQLLRVVHEKKYKNIEIAQKIYSIDQNPQMSDVCTLSKTLA